MPVAEKITTATELAKQTKRVLDEATKGPVSITRPNKPAITLVERDRYFEAAYALEWLSTYNAIVRYVVELAQGDDPMGCPTDFPWLRYFDLEDLREFVDELSVALHSAIHHLRPWHDVDAVVEEWRRSSAVASNEELQRRFKQTLGDIPNEPDR